MGEQQGPGGQGGSEAAEASVGDAENQPTGADISAGGQEARADPGSVVTKDGSRFGRFIRRLLRWGVLLLVIFTLGVVAMHFVQVQPLRAERNDLTLSLVEAEESQQELQAEIDKLEGVEAENQVLTESIKQKEARLTLLNVLVDVTRAQLALAQDEPVGVAAALQATGEKLRSLRDLLGTSAAPDLEGSRERLVLVLSEVDNDPFAAERDLEILANTILEIERELSGE